VRVQVRLYPPLNNTAGVERLTLELEEGADLGDLVAVLADRFGEALRVHLYDRRGIIPGWCAFVNDRPNPFNRPESLSLTLSEGDRVSFLLNLAGG